MGELQGWSHFDLQNVDRPLDIFSLTTGGPWITGLGKCILQYHEDTFCLSPSMLDIGNTEMKNSFFFVCACIYQQLVVYNFNLPKVGNSYV
jgi:hypothetical protein